MIYIYYMPSRTIYVKESELPTWDRATKELGNVSQVVLECIKKALERKMSTETVEKMEKIVLDFWDCNDNPTIKKSFVGRWLIDPSEEVMAADETQRWYRYTYGVAQTQKGAIVVYTTDRNERYKPEMSVPYDSFDDLKNAKNSEGDPKYPSNVIAMTAAALGEPYEIELDI